MISVSKIRYFLITLTLTIILGSCNKQNDVIPDVYVDFTLDLYDPQFVNLNALLSSDTVDRYTNNWGYGAAGWNDNGIIICNGPDMFYAYDRTCPHGYVSGGLSIKVNIDSTFSSYAVCPKCGTKYALAAGGTPASGVGRYPLKNYKTSFNGRTVRVWNH